MDDKTSDPQSPMLNSLLADEINAIIQYVACSESCDHGDHAEVHKVILEINVRFPDWLQPRIDYLNQASGELDIIKGIQS